MYICNFTVNTRSMKITQELIENRDWRQRVKRWATQEIIIKL